MRTENITARQGVAVVMFNVLLQDYLDREEEGILFLPTPLLGNRETDFGSLSECPLGRLILGWVAGEHRWDGPLHQTWSSG